MQVYTVDGGNHGLKVSRGRRRAEMGKSDGGDVGDAVSRAPGDDPVMSAFNAVTAFIKVRRAWHSKYLLCWCLSVVAKNAHVVSCLFG